jgi:diguanylate cyclase (GGDEF)-like protein
MMIDIDGFKEYNDLHGHQEGDSILSYIGKTIKSLISERCMAFRYGGEELAVIVQALRAEDAFQLAEKIRNEIESSGKITVSIGLVTCRNSSSSPSAMVSEADKALYKAKKAGKNRVHSSIIIDKAINPIDVQEASEIGKP